MAEKGELVIATTVVLSAHDCSTAKADESWERLLRWNQGLRTLLR
jgi:hypothetical protein